MIVGPSKYSKDQSIIPEGIMLTLPVAFFEDRKWGCEGFIKMFERYMSKEDSIWNFRLTNLPTHEVAWVYLVFDKKVQFRVNMVMYERNVSKYFYDGPDKKERAFPSANWVILSGPAIRPPHEWPQKGFQGFRYTTKLF
jgi:hypothetical protein